MSAAFAYNQSESTQRVPIRWQSPQVSLVLSHNSTDVSANQSAVIMADVINQWNSLVPFSLQQTSYGRNTVSYSNDPRFFGPGVVAVTVLSYDPAVGRVVDGQIYVNQTETRGFCLTADQAANNCTTPGAGFLSRVYLGDVLAHELGHLMGLGHSEVRDSTMVFTSFKGQSSPHTDDVAGVRSIYNSANSGTLAGRVLGGNNIPVFGAHVQAISNLRGTVAAAAFSQEDGSFEILGLDLNDTYYIYVEPLRRLESLSDAYRSAKTEFCPAAYVGSFFEKCGTSGKGHPQPLSLTTSRTSINVGVVSIRCQLRVGENYLKEKIETNGGQYDFIASTQKPGQAFVGLYSAAEPLSTFDYSDIFADTIELDYTSMAVPAGSVSLELKFITTALGSPLDASIEVNGPFGILTDSDRPQIGGMPVLAFESGTLKAIYNRKITYPLSGSAALNRLTVKVKPRALSTSEQISHMVFPDVFSLTDRPWLMLVNVLRNGQIYYQNQESVLSDNSTCMDAPYTFAVRPNPVSASALAGLADESASSTTAGAAPACGTWEPPSNGPGAGPGAMLMTISLGFLVTLLKRRRSNS